MEEIKSVQKKGLSTGVRITLVYVVSIVLGAALASLLARLYIKIFPSLPISGFYGFDVDPNNLLDGFFIGYSFFLSLSVAFFLKNNKHRFWTWFVGVILFLLIELGEWRHLGFDLLVSFLGYLAGLGILFVENRVSASKG